MFAVKGWAVDASSLKPQEAPQHPQQEAPPPVPENSSAPQDKKRKRGDRPGAVNVDNVAKLWDQHIEGKRPKNKNKEAQKARKKQKLQQDVETPNETVSVETTESKSADAPEGAAGEKKAKGKKEKKSKAQPNGDKTQTEKSLAPTSQPAKAAPAPAVPLPPASKLTPMQAAMRQKLVSARFRHLNQTLYTEASDKALELFSQNPEMFEDYHSGFRQQVTQWPENPVDTFITAIRARGGVRLFSQKRAFKDKRRKPEPAPAPATDNVDGQLQPLPRTHGTAIIADLGCGDARLAQTFKENEEGQKLQLKIHSYDLHSPSALVTKADISNIPSADGSVDIAIFCLALMGTNWISFVEEAYRILHWKGELWIAEIKSRFGRVSRAGKPVEHSVGGRRKQAALQKIRDSKKQQATEAEEQEALQVEVDGAEVKNEETDVSAFVDVLRRRGFLLKNGDASIDLSNKMFVKMEFIKAAAPTKGKGVPADGAVATPAPKFKKAKFLDENKDEVTTDDEARVLKPCLYKIR